MAAENWLNDEQFDFDLNLSRSSMEENVFNTTEEDDEVFFGAVTHKVGLAYLSVCQCL